MELKDQIISFIDESVVEAFTAMMMGEPKRTDTIPIPIPEQPTDIICSIGFTGMIEGAFSICASSAGACKVVSKMLDMEITEVTADVTDGIGEVINIVVGGVKTRLAGLNYDFEIGIPTLVKGKDLKMTNSGDETEIKSGFFCEELEFGIIAIYKIAGGAAKKEEIVVQAESESEAVVVESVKEEAKAPVAEEASSAEDDFAKDVAAVVGSVPNISSDSSAEKKDEGQGLESESSESALPKDEKQEQAASGAWAALENLEEGVEKEADKPEEEKSSSSAADLLGSIVQESEVETKEEPKKQDAGDAASLLGAIVQESEDKPEQSQGKEDVEGGGVPEKSDEKTGVGSIDTLIKDVSDKAKREQGKEGSESAAASLSALIQDGGDLCEDETTVTAGVLSKEKVSELMICLEKIPNDMLTKSEVEDILKSILRSLSSEEAGLEVSAKVDEALKKLDDILVKIKAG